ncbi:hypothetical protein [Agrobacterium cavarae]|uniref:hypothetical protein n=1 Tax=Agrobacterium cavarae TaxID=2528239 RepID=UPI002FD9080F
MWVWIKRGLVVAVLAYSGYAIWDYHRAGYFSRPEMPEGAFSISYKTGLRAILVDVEDQRETRRYFGFPMDVPFYLKDAWSLCSPPTKDERPKAEKFIADRSMIGERFEVVCRIQVDNEEVIRGLITSVPRL